MNSNIIQMPHSNEKTHERINDEAITWLVELDCGLSEERKNTLQQWLAQSEQHRLCFMQQAKLWDDLEVLSQLADILPYDNIVPKSQKSKYYAIAASFAACLLVIAWVSQFSWREIAKPVEQANILLIKNSYATQKGEFKKYVLPDDSVLTLNTDTMVNIHFDQQYRNIYLDHGELHIEVAHDASRPLNIIVGDSVIQAIGTAFNVQFVNQHDVELIVSAGKVLLTNDSALEHKLNFSNLSQEPENALFLSAGQKVSFSQNQAIRKDEMQVEDVSERLASSLSWLKGSLIFSGEPMSYAIAKVNRYLENPILLNGEEIKNIRVIGRFEHGKLEQFLGGLAAGFHINQSKNSKGQIVLSLAK
ncbi:MAG: transmembrane sensor [Candidatus Azotimanducaceae bacterium]|jgi:transmembrane sensor